MPSTYSGDGATFDTSPHFTSIANILIRAYVNHPDRRDAINDLLGIAQELARAMPRVPTAVAYIEFQKYVFDELARVTTPPMDTTLGAREIENAFDDMAGRVEKLIEESG